MKVLDMHCESDFSYPEDMNLIIDYVEKKGKLNVGYTTLEKLWYVFSEKYSAHFLHPDDGLMEEFVEWISTVDTDTAERMNYYGEVEDLDDALNEGVYDI